MALLSLAKPGSPTACQTPQELLDPSTSSWIDSEVLPAEVPTTARIWRGSETRLPAVTPPPLRSASGRRCIHLHVPASLTAIDSDLASCGRGTLQREGNIVGRRPDIGRGPTILYPLPQRAGNHAATALWTHLGLGQIRTSLTRPTQYPFSPGWMTTCLISHLCPGTAWTHCDYSTVRHKLRSKTTPETLRVTPRLWNNRPGLGGLTT